MEKRSTQKNDRNEFRPYLPAMPQASAEPTRIERFLTRLFRRRGGLRRVVRPKHR
ncbi:MULTISPECIES: hypothetical protein [Halococcus]|uniref:hypothetical protein n=1 Tax=Halococcus TaxID=2249 RepID=UPI000AF67A21|nr:MULTISPECIES: hypothetical protein [Halococcus]